MSGEKARLRAEIEEYAELTGRLTRLLTLTANALKGEPPEHVWHDWSDLPRVAAEIVAREEQLSIRVVELDQQRGRSDPVAWGAASHAEPQPGRNERVT